MRLLIYFVSVLLLPFFSGEDQTTLTNSEIQAVLDAHNYWRRDVGVTEKLTWSDDLAEVADKWVRELKRKGCAFEHSPDNSFGENLFKGTSDHFDAKYVVDAWAGEKAYYNYDKNRCKSGEMCGHYTQIVWQATERVGCAKIQCDGMDIWSCNYDPPGNWVNQKPY